VKTGSHGTEIAGGEKALQGSFTFAEEKRGRQRKCIGKKGASGGGVRVGLDRRVCQCYQIGPRRRR